MATLLLLKEETMKPYHDAIVPRTAATTHCAMRKKRVNDTIAT